MKNRNLEHSDNWATPPYFYEQLNKKWNFDFDPCPLIEGEIPIEKNGLIIEWGDINYINPPYSRLLKEAFVNKAVLKANKGSVCVLLLPVSTSTKLFHEIIKPNYKIIDFVKGRIPFIGINQKGEYVNWHLWDNKAPDGVIHVKNSGQHDSMIVVF